MGLVEKFKELKQGTKAKLVKVFSKKYQPTYEEVQKHIKHTYTSKANAIINLTGDISYFSESWFGEVKEYVNGKIMEMVPLKREGEVADVFSETYYKVEENKDKVVSSYETHYVPSHTAAVEYVKKQKHLPKTDRTALLDSIAYTHKQVLEAKDKYLDRFSALTPVLLRARIAKIKSLEAENTQTTAPTPNK